MYITHLTNEEIIKRKYLKWNKVKLAFATILTVIMITAALFISWYDTELFETIFPQTYKVYSNVTTEIIELETLPVLPEINAGINEYYSSEAEIEETPNANDIEGGAWLIHNFNVIWFEETVTYNTIVDISGFGINFIGMYNYINPEDFTDMILTRDGEPVDNILIYSDIECYTAPPEWNWNHSTVTHVFFSFEKENTEPGVYSFSGKYKNTPFKAHEVVVQKYQVDDTPANPDDLFSVGLGYSDEPIIYFTFNGKQESFYKSDLVDLKITIDGEEVKFLLGKIKKESYCNAYYNPEEIFTDYGIILKDFPVIDGGYVPGEYEITGKYMGKQFEQKFTMY